MKHTYLSHLLSIISLSNISSLCCTFGRGPLTNTSVLRDSTLLSRLIKSHFSISDWCFAISRASVCMIKDFIDGCSAVIFRIFSEIPDTMLLTKQYFGDFQVAKALNLKYTTLSPTIKVLNPEVRSFCFCSFCSCSFCSFFDLASYLSLVFKDKPSLGECMSSWSGSNLFLSWIWTSWPGLLLLFAVACVPVCFLLGLKPHSCGIEVQVNQFQSLGIGFYQLSLFPNPFLALLQVNSNKDYWLIYWCLRRHPLSCCYC